MKIDIYTADDARQVLIEFINAMNAWELKYYPLFRYGNRALYEAEARAALTQIFDCWCHAKSGIRDRLIALNCAEPPECSTENNEITANLEDGPTVTFDVIQKTGLKNTFRFTAKKGKDG